ncbi:MAG TPA: zf-HC2 domain-containing protein [Thermoanaerobaculia bacterium]|nr:zf-HC2 domain-containing protein [Thermoanaerobaculia bacterium]
MNETLDRPIITCRELIDFIADYLDRALEPVQQLDFDRHIARCSSCRAYLASYETTIRLAKAANTEDQAIVDAAPDDLIRAILAMRK